MPFRVAYLTIDQPTGDLLRRAATQAADPFDVVGQDLSGFDADVGVLGPGVGDPIAQGQALLRAHPNAQLVLLSERDRLQRLRDGLPFVPNLASTWTAAVDIGGDALVTLLAKAADAARKRQSASALRTQINRQLVRGADQTRSDEAEAQRLRQLAQSEDYLATLLSQAPDAFVALSVAGGIVAWNEAAERLFGVAAARAIGADAATVLPEELRPELAELSTLAIQGRAFTGRQIAFESPQGHRWVEVSLAPVRDDEGGVSSLSMTARDVSERIHNEDALRRSEAQLREANQDLERKVVERTQARGRTWQVSPDLLGALNAEGYFKTSNPAWQVLLGWSEDEVAATPIWDLLHPDDVERTRAGFQLNQASQPLLHFPNRLRCKDGGYRWISWVGVPEDGLVYCSGRDITDHKAAEEALAKTEEALRQAQKMEAVGQLTGGIAHDFNNLLAGIGGALELLEKRLEQGRLSEATRYIDAAQSSTRRAAALTQRLLAFSRRQTLDPRPVDANKLIAGMEELIRRSVGPEVAVEVVGAGGLWLTKVDTAQLESALLNLAINARDAMAPAGGRLTIETANKWLDDRASKERDLAPGQYISICVTDTGTGMEPDVIARVFEPFYTTKPLGRGTGLGLSMVHGFVRQSGGQVRIYSELGSGTTMCLYLPRYVGDIETIDEGPAEEVDQGDGETVLVIDDEPTIRMLIAEVLTENGYAVLEAEDGPSGLRLLQSDRRVDLLITDVGLPGGVNGRQVADAARVQRPGLKVLFITGYAENAAVGNGLLDLGMEVITKPFTMIALGQKVREMIDRKMT